MESIARAASAPTRRQVLRAMRASALELVYEQFCSSSSNVSLREDRIDVELLGERLDALNRVVPQGRLGADGNIGRSARQIRCYYELGRAAAASSSRRSNHLRACEVGYNVGHSAVVHLSALGSHGTASRYLGFDLGFTKERDWRRVRGAGLINETLFPARLRLVMGDSRTTIPEHFRREPHTKCDLVSLDADHSVEAIARDWDALRPHIVPGAPVLIDDVGRTYVERGEDAPVYRNFFGTRRGELRLVGCVRMRGLFDEEMIHRVLTDGSDEAKRNRSLRTLVASDGFCIAQAL